MRCRNAVKQRWRDDLKRRLKMREEEITVKVSKRQQSTAWRKQDGNNITTWSSLTLKLNEILEWRCSRLFNVTIYSRATRAEQPSAASPQCRSCSKKQNEPNKSFRFQPGRDMGATPGEFLLGEVQSAPPNKVLQFRRICVQIKISTCFMKRCADDAPPGAALVLSEAFHPLLPAALKWCSRRHYPLQTSQAAAAPLKQRYEAGLIWILKMVLKCSSDAMMQS